MTEYLAHIFHHRGHFERVKGVLLYCNEKIERFREMDVNLDFFDLVTLFKGLGYSEYKLVMWKKCSSNNLDIALRPLNGDKKK